MRAVNYHPLLNVSLQRKVSIQAKRWIRAIERAVRKHVSDHLEQLVFLSLFREEKWVPKPNMMTRKSRTILTDADEDFRSEINSIVSKDTHLSKRDVHIANVRNFIAKQEDFNGNLVKGVVPGKLVTYNKQPTSSDGIRHHSNQTIGVHPTPPSFSIKLLMHPPNEHFYARHNLLAEAEKALNLPGTICISRELEALARH